MTLSSTLLARGKDVASRLDEALAASKVSASADERLSHTRASATRDHGPHHRARADAEPEPTPTPLHAAPTPLHHRVPPRPATPSAV